MTEQEWTEKLKSEGFVNFGVVSQGPNIDFGEHTHDKHTVHVILDGELIIVDRNGEKIFRPTERIEFPAGTMHRAKSGPAGLKMIVGVKEK